MRKLTDVGQKTTLATLYQAGEDIYKHFDKVLLIDDGYEIFFGRTEEARPYFEELGFVHLPGQTTAEFLAAVTDPLERIARPDSIAARVRSAQDLAATFKASPIYSRMLDGTAVYLHRNPAGEALFPTPTYNLSYLQQIYECLLREYMLTRGQAAFHYVKWINTLILSLVIGSLYYDVKADSNGVFDRGGIIFFALIVNGWFQFPGLFEAHKDRPVLERQCKLLSGLGPIHLVIC